MEKFLSMVRVQWDRTAATAAAALALLLFVVGWFGVSDKAFAEQQIPYLVSCGLVGLLLIAGSATLWLSADLRDEWRKLDDIDRRLAEMSASSVGAVLPRQGEDRGDRLDLLEVDDVAPRAPRAPRRRASLSR